MPAQPAWTPDGKALLYARYGPVEGEIVRHVMDGSVADQVVLRLPGTWFCPWSISPDGRFLLFSRYVPETGSDLLLLDLEAAPGAESVKPFVATPGHAYGAAISPNGEWFAYFSNESGRRELLIEKFPERGQKTLVGTGAPGPPVWSPDGRELYFTAAGTPGSGETDMMAVDIELTPTLRASAPRRLFSAVFSVTATDMGRSFGIAPDGRRFLLVRNPQGVYTVGSSRNSATQLLVVQNWFAELRRSRGEAVQR
jgi:Tol biopolymer transport system component